MKFLRKADEMEMSAVQNVIFFGSKLYMTRKMTRGKKDNHEE